MDAAKTRNVHTALPFNFESLQLAGSVSNGAGVPVMTLPPKSLQSPKFLPPPLPRSLSFGKEAQLDGVPSWVCPQTSFFSDEHPNTIMNTIKDALVSLRLADVEVTPDKPSQIKAVTTAVPRCLFHVNLYCSARDKDEVVVEFQRVSSESGGSMAFVQAYSDVLREISPSIVSSPFTSVSGSLSSASSSFALDNDFDFDFDFDRAAALAQPPDFMDTEELMDDVLLSAGSKEEQLQQALERACQMLEDQYVDVKHQGAASLASLLRDWKEPPPMPTAAMVVQHVLSALSSNETELVHSATLCLSLLLANVKGPSHIPSNFVDCVEPMLDILDSPDSLENLGIKRLISVTLRGLVQAGVGVQQVSQGLDVLKDFTMSGDPVLADNATAILEKCR